MSLTPYRRVLSRPGVLRLLLVATLARVPVTAAGVVLGLPIFAVARQSLSVLVPEEEHRTAYSLDSMGVELSFMAGPALGVIVATQVSTTVALVGVGICMVLAGLALFVFDPPTRSLHEVVPAVLGGVR